MKNGKPIAMVSLAVCLSILVGCGNANSQAHPSQSQKEASSWIEPLEASHPQEASQESFYEGFVDVDDGLYHITGYHGDEEDILVPDTLGNAPVGHIGAEAFRDCRCRSILLPDTVVDIGTRAFVGCTMERIYLGKGLKTVGGTAFGSCGNLQELEFFDGFEKFDGLSIYDCGKLLEVRLPLTAVFESDEIFMGLCPNAVVVAPGGSAADDFCRRKGYAVENRDEPPCE